MAIKARLVKATHNRPTEVKAASLWDTAADIEDSVRTASESMNEAIKYAALLKRKGGPSGSVLAKKISAVTDQLYGLASEVEEYRDEIGD